ncbi:MAG: aminotransferase class V-fold PLP-dependent enzyme [Labilithrix sp.]|nr:aminotransferase class V-fold PLP-dependent enzyme [Labilithrix sp.]
MRAYLDWNATTPPLAEVQDAMRDAAARAWANPSSIHGDGRAARAVIEDARASVAELAGTDPRDVVFTSGGTEANNLALRSAFPAGAASTASPRSLLTSRLEHPSVTRVAEALEREGRAHVRWLDVTAAGTIDLADLDRALAEPSTPALVTVQAVNHETGVLQPVAEVIARAHAAGARVHVDAVQGWGKVDVPPGWDTASVAPHKMRGPKGIGALATREGARIDPVLVGGSQEKGIRPGTIDAALAAGFGAAARIASRSVARWASLGALRDRLEADLLALDAPLGRARVAGDPSVRAPHVSNLIWPGWIGAELVAALDLEGVSASSGAACSAGTVEPSPVLLAMLGPTDAARGVRLSIGDATTAADTAHALRAFRAVLGR